MKYILTIFFLFFINCSSYKDIIFVKIFPNDNNEFNKDVYYASFKINNNCHLFLDNDTLFIFELKKNVDTIISPVEFNVRDYKVIDDPIILKMVDKIK